MYADEYRKVDWSRVDADLAEWELTYYIRNRLMPGCFIILVMVYLPSALDSEGSIPSSTVGFFILAMAGLGGLYMYFVDRRRKLRMLRWLHRDGTPRLARVAAIGSWAGTITAVCLLDNMKITCSALPGQIQNLKPGDRVTVLDGSGIFTSGRYRRSPWRYCVALWEPR